MAVKENERKGQKKTWLLARFFTDKRSIC